MLIEFPVSEHYFITLWAPNHPYYLESCVFYQKNTTDHKITSSVCNSY